MLWLYLLWTVDCELLDCGCDNRCMQLITTSFGGSLPTVLWAAHVALCGLLNSPLPLWSTRPKSQKAKNSQNPHGRSWVSPTADHDLTPHLQLPSSKCSPQILHLHHQCRRRHGMSARSVVSQSRQMPIWLRFGYTPWLAGRCLSCGTIIFDEIF